MNNFDKLNSIYNQIMDITKQIHSILEVDFTDEINNKLDEREDLIKQANSIKEKNSFNTEELKELEKIVEATQELERKNFALIEKLRSSNLANIANMTRNSKVINAYRYKQPEANHGGTDEGA